MLHVALEIVDRYRGNDPHRRGCRLAIEALGYRRNRRAGGGDRCRGSLPGTRARPAHRRLHGVWGAGDDGSGALHARRSSIGVPLLFLGIGYMAGGGIGYALLVIGGALVGTGVPGYLRAESAILGLAVIALAAGTWLAAYAVARGAAQSTHGTSGSREAES